jgi:hypothetical protein
MSRIAVHCHVVLRWSNIGKWSLTVVLCRRLAAAEVGCNLTNGSRFRQRKCKPGSTSRCRDTAEEKVQSDLTTCASRTIATPKGYSSHGNAEFYFRLYYILTCVAIPPATTSANRNQCNFLPPPTFQDRRKALGSRLTICLSRSATGAQLCRHREGS